jgi:hypothetical protein
VDDPVTEDADVILAFDVGEVVVLDKGIENGAKGIALADFLANLAVLDDGCTTPLVLECRRGCRQAADLGLCDPSRRRSLLGGVHRDLHRGGARVDGQDSCLHFAFGEFGRAVSVNDR